MEHGNIFQVTSIMSQNYRCYDLCCIRCWFDLSSWLLHCEQFASPVKYCFLHDSVKHLWSHTPLPHAWLGPRVRYCSVNVSSRWIYVFGGLLADRDAESIDHDSWSVHCCLSSWYSHFIVYHVIDLLTLSFECSDISTMDWQQKCNMHMYVCVIPAAFSVEPFIYLLRSDGYDAYSSLTLQKYNTKEETWEFLKRLQIFANLEKSCFAQE